MNSNSILTSDLLDIIFENRNKDYGAYDLRKKYDTRLLKSLGAVLALVSVFIIWQINTKVNMPTISSHTIVIDGNTLVSFKKPVQPVQEKHNQATIKSPKNLSDKPVIVKAIVDNKKQSIDFQAPSSNTNGKPDTSPSDANGSEDANPKGDNNKGSLAPIAKPTIDKNIPVVAEVLPQFPGGIDALIKYLKKNLNTPQDMEAGEVVAVRVRFIVNYNGDLVSLEVIEKGGQSFDNEVIRVLKKMPKWIPGKSRGENVSAYYEIPVKFTVSN